jgi:imidazolonepropionase-like amidohydrolase
MFHTDSTWREMVKWVELGVPAMEVIQSATLWPGRFFRRDDLGTLAPGSLADIIAVPGDPLTDMSVVGRVQIVVKGGEVVKGEAR